MFIFKEESFCFIGSDTEFCSGCIRQHLAGNVRENGFSVRAGIGIVMLGFDDNDAQKSIRDIHIRFNDDFDLFGIVLREAFHR